MNKVLKCRRSTLGLIALVMLFILGIRGGDVGSHIVGIIVAVAGANAAQAVMERKQND